MTKIFFFPQAQNSKTNMKMTQSPTTFDFNKERLRINVQYFYQLIRDNKAETLLVVSRDQRTKREIEKNSTKHLCTL